MNPTDLAVTSLQEANQALFVNAFDAATAQEGIVETLATRTTSKALVERHNFLGTVPKMRDTTYQPVILEELSRFSFTIENREWTSALEIHRLAIETDQLGYLQPRINQLAREAARHDSELILSNMAAPGACFDGVAYFTDHTAIGGGTTIDNTLSVAAATGTTPTVAEFQEAVNQARARMREFTDDKGRPMNLTGDTIVVPAELETTAWFALNGVFIPGMPGPPVPPMQNGVLSGGGYKLIVNPYLTNAAIFYVYHTRSEVKPFIAQQLAAPAMSMTDTGSDLWVIHNKLVQAVRKVGNVGPTDPRYGIEVTFT